MSVWVGGFIPVPSISPEILDSRCYCLLTAKAVAKLFYLDGDSGKLAESRRPEEKISHVFFTWEFFTVHKSENMSRALNDTLPWEHLFAQI